MLKGLFTYCLLACVLCLKAQNMERKIIIEGGKYYYTTIHEEFQVGTLYSGNYDSPIKEGQKWALPAGRNYSEPVNPFCWDISGSFVYAISFLMHPLNDRNEAIKKIKKDQLKEWTTETKVQDLLMQSVEMNMMVYNDPYKYVTKKSKILEQFYFDGISMNDSTYCMAISNKGELSVWNCVNQKWSMKLSVNMNIKGYFSLFKLKNKMYLILSDCTTFEISGDKLKPVSTKLKGMQLTDGVIVENRDNKTIGFLKNGTLNSEKSLKEELSKKSIKLL